MKDKMLRILIILLSVAMIGMLTFGVVYGMCLLLGVKTFTIKETACMFAIYNGIDTLDKGIKYWFN